MGNLCKQYKELSNVLLKPNKISYDPERDLFESESLVKGVPVLRHDFEILNDDKFNVVCHLLYPETVDKDPINLVCFLHTRGGNALEGKFLVNAMLPNVAVLLFNFAGSGLSEGEYVSLGMNETRDFKLILDEVKNTIPVGKVCLWGRSMGAVTSIMFTKLWNNSQKFFVTKEEYIEHNKGDYKKFMKKKEKEDKDKKEKEEEDEEEGEKETDEIDLKDDKSDGLDMEKDLLESGKVPN